MVHDRNGNGKRLLSRGLLLFEGVHCWVEDEFVVGDNWWGSVDKHCWGVFKNTGGGG